MSNFREFKVVKESKMLLKNIS